MAGSPRISLIVPTQRRPEGLAKAARSLFNQKSVDTTKLELVIVDNDVRPSAEPVSIDLRRDAPFPLVYVHEPAPGVARARNAAMAAAKGEFIAFLDDDEEATEGWLAALVEVQARWQADAVFGPLEARAPETVAEHRDYFVGFFSRTGPAEDGPIGRHYGCGNSLVRRAAMPDSIQPFRMVRNLIGGEDDLLFGEMRQAGARFAWASAALAFEDPVPERLSLRYTLRRAFAYGQGPTSACAIASPPNRLGVARWMVIGILQAVFLAPCAALKWALRSPDRAFIFDRLMRGIGKTLWWGPFKIQFYGRAA
ncbi:MAG: glycosyltransferase [Caulobacteraceae bacterium]